MCAESSVSSKTQDVLTTAVLDLLLTAGRALRSTACGRDRMRDALY